MRRDRLRWLTARPIAHRGLHDLARGKPENTLAAFAAAMQSGYAIECDLHPSSDNMPVVFHDDELKRLIGVKGCVRDFTAADLRTMRVAGTDERIPTLDNLLTQVAGRVPLVLELKHMPGRDAGFAWAVVQRLKSYDGPAAVMSFETSLLEDVRAAGPFIPCGLTAEGGWQAAYRNVRAMVKLGVDFVSYRIDDLPTLAPLFANRALGIPLIAWTVRDAAQLARARTWADQITFEGFTP